MPREEDFLDVGDAEATPAPGGFGLDGQGEMPSMEQILDMIEQAAGLSDEEKAAIKEDVINFQRDKDAGFVGSAASGGNLATAAATAGGFLAPGNIVFVVLVTLLALVFGKCMEIYVVLVQILISKNKKPVITCLRTFSGIFSRTPIHLLFNNYFTYTQHRESKNGNL